MNDSISVVIYGDEFCAYCAAARMLFTRKGVHFEDVLVSRDPARFDEMQARSGGRRSVPQVFIGDVHVGGFDDLCSLDNNGELDKLLAGEIADQRSL
jgi:glutaredoxin 3